MLDDADLTGANVARADLSEARLPRAQLSNAVLNSLLTSANLQEVQGDSVDLRGADLTGADLSRARLSKTVLAYAKGKGLQASDAELSAIDFENATLTYANFGRARLTDSSFFRSDLSNAAFSGAEVHNVKLEQAVLSGVKDLSDSMLAAALAVDEAKLPRALIDGGVRLESASSIEQRVRPACAGTAAEGTRPYEVTEEFHPVVVHQTEQGAGRALTSVRQAVHDAKWEPMAARHAELVACIDNWTSSLVEFCGTYGIEGSGERVTLTRLQASQRVRMVASASGQVVAERTFFGSVPRACDEREAFSSAQVERRAGAIQGSDPDFAEMKAWIGEVARA